MPTLLIMEVFSNFPVPLISKPLSSITLWNKKVENYIYSIFGFTNKYLYSFGVVVFLHDDDPLILKEIKLFLKNNGYEIHSWWVVINTLLRMSLDIKGRKVMFCPHSCLDQSIFQNPLYNLIFNFCNVDSSQLGNFYCSNYQGFQVLGSSCKHGETWCFIGGGWHLYNHANLDNMERSKSGVPFKGG